MLSVVALLLAVGPWTGTDVSTAPAAPMRERVVVTGTPSGNVRLLATGLPPGWIASWCTTRVCAVGTTRVRLDPRGRAVVELTIVPLDAARPPWPTVRLRASAGAESARAAFVARPR